MKNGNKPAAAIFNAEGFTSNLDAGLNDCSGLTKLEHFAGLAMQGYLAMCQGRDQPSESEVACESLMYAKELLKHLEAEANE